MRVSKKSSETIDEAAGDWLARRDGEAWTAVDQVDFECWVNASDLHRVAFLRLEHAWEEGRRLKALGAGVSAGQRDRLEDICFLRFLIPVTSPAKRSATVSCFLGGGYVGPRRRQRRQCWSPLSPICSKVESSQACTIRLLSAKSHRFLS